jgi:hypothetical protein
MRELISAYWSSQLVFVMARLGVADVLARGPRTPETIAAAVGAKAPQLRRALRALAGLGVAREASAGRFRLTALGETLRSGRPGSLRDFTLMMVDDYNWRAWGALLHGITSDERPFDRVHGMPFFEYLARHSEQEATFAASMASISGTENDAVARAYPFGKLERLVDVGGAHGHLLATVLRRHKKLRGIPYDQPQGFSYGWAGMSFFHALARGAGFSPSSPSSRRAAGDATTASRTMPAGGSLKIEVSGPCPASRITDTSGRV